ncbi:MAG: hypothetical protein Q8903_07035 [Bacteroidota bacterium]|nr:hypothetical protein [Bacteroidota bacterium]
MKLDEKENLIEKDYVIFLNYFKSKFPVFHKSNIFFLDIQYGIKHFFEQKDIKTTYTEIDKLSSSVISFFEQKGIFEKLDSKVWKINYPDFVCTTPGDPL